MPAIDQTESPGERVMRQHYQGRIADRMAQVASMAANRELLRRGARKMQDGTLAQPGDPTEEDPMNIRVGDEVNHYYPASIAEPSQLPTIPETTPSTPPGTLAKLAISAALLASGAGVGAGIPWLLGAFSQKPPAAQEYIDTTTSIGISGGEPTMKW